jgi:hypothetical protein
MNREKQLCTIAGVDINKIPELDGVGKKIAEIACELASAERSLINRLESLLTSATSDMHRATSTLAQPAGPSGVACLLHGLGDPVEDAARYAETVVRVELLNAQLRTLTELRSALAAA